MANKGWRIVIEDGRDRHAICKILPLSDGGYSLVAPYHSANEGWLMKHKVDYHALPTYISLDEMQHYTASDRVKLSHHFDGFVQFSGENPQKIISGRNPLTGMPRGLALMSKPIWDPIITGPTFGIIVWGVHEFKHVTDRRESDLIFRAAELHCDDDATPTRGSYAVDGWVFGGPMWAGVRGQGNDRRISVNFPTVAKTSSGQEALTPLEIMSLPYITREFRVLPLESEKTDCFLGIRARQAWTGWKSPSGFSMGGPSRPIGDHVSEMLKAVYPRDDMINGYDSSSLNYRPNDA